MLEDDLDFRARTRAADEIGQCRGVRDPGIVEAENAIARGDCSALRGAVAIHEANSPPLGRAALLAPHAALLSARTPHAAPVDLRDHVARLQTGLFRGGIDAHAVDDGLGPQRSRLEKEAPRPPPSPRSPAAKAAPVRPAPGLRH